MAGEWEAIGLISSSLFGFLGANNQANAQENIATTQAKYQYDAFMAGLDFRRDALNQQKGLMEMQLLSQERADKRDYRLALRALESDAHLRLKEMEYGHEENMTSLKNDARTLEIERLEAGKISTDDLGLFA